MKPIRKRSGGRRLTVLKLGGSILDRPAGAAVLDEVAALWRTGEEILIVHGGGRELSLWLDRLSIESRFVGGQRVTSQEVLPIALMVLGGLVNRSTVAELGRRGCEAVGLTGADGGGTSVEPIDTASLGAVGRVASVNVAFYRNLIAGRRLPIVASLGFHPDHGWLNVNADLMAGALAAALKARRLLMMTDVPGVRGGDGAPIESLTLQEMRRLLRAGEASDGMIPKLHACRMALDARVPEVRILGSTEAGMRGTQVRP
jgi:acetylglutamate kinase